VPVFNLFGRRPAAAPPAPPPTLAGVDLLFGPRPVVSPPPAPVPPIPVPSIPVLSVPVPFAPVLSIAPKLPADASALIHCFESLGDNCEFGLVQRYLGCERLSAFRFNFSPVASLIEGFDKRFADVAEPGALTGTFEVDEWVMRETRYGYSWHTFRDDRTMPMERLLREQTNWLRYLIAKLLEDLRESERIFVRKGEGPEHEAEIRRLFAAIRRDAPNVTLLWVKLADAAHPPGTVAWLEDGLMQGWIARFAPYDDAPRGSIDAWLAVCRSAWALRFRGDARAYPLHSAPSVLPLGFGGWTGSSHATASFDWSVASPEGTDQVMRHSLVEDYSGSDLAFGCMTKDGVRADAIYCFSAWLRLAEDFTAPSPWVVLLGLPSLATSGVDLECRGRWQRVWVSARLPPDRAAACPCLVLRGPAGTTIHTTGWRLQAGLTPDLG
jgi:hypothetical protein